MLSIQFNADGPEYETWRDNSEMASVAATYISGPLKVVEVSSGEILASVKTD